MKFLYPILVLPGVVALFLPFAHSTSLWDMFPLAFPLSLSFIIFLWSIRVLIKNQLTKAEIVIAYLLATLAIISSLAMTISSIAEKATNLLLLLFPLILIFFSILVVDKNRRKHMPHKINAAVSMHVTYFPQAILCLILFRGSLEIGAYLVVFTCIVYLCEIMLLNKRMRVIS